MARIGIVTCSNCTRDLDCASVVCLADLRKRRGLFGRYPPDRELVLVGVISCAGCPTAGAPQKILRRVRSLVEFRVDAIHFSYCITALCPFREQYAAVIRAAHPAVELVPGTHTPPDPRVFQAEVQELLCAPRAAMTDLIKGRPANRPPAGGCDHV